MNSEGAQAPSGDSEPEAAEAGSMNPLAMGTTKNVLPSGRRLELQVGDSEERLEIRSPEGELELSVVLTADGPVLKLRGARLEIDSNDTVAVQCRRFELNTEEDVALHAKGSIQMNTDDEVRVKSAQQTFIDGDYVNINCLERTGYHDEEEAKAEAEAEAVRAKELADAQALVDPQEPSA